MQNYATIYLFNYINKKKNHKYIYSKIMKQVQINLIQANNVVQANATSIIKKFKSLQDRVNFCMEEKWFHSSEPGFHASHFLMVLAGKKIYLPCNFAIGYKMKGENKTYIIDKMMGTKYIPNRLRITLIQKNIQRHFCLIRLLI